MMTETSNSSSTAGADELDLFEAEATGQPVTKSETIPSKYEGKSVEDLIKMHQNAEKLIGKQSQEVSTLRRMSDEILNVRAQSTTQTKKEEVHSPVTVEALLNDPEKALKLAVENSEAAKRAAAAEARVARLEEKLAEREFIATHKTVDKDVNDPEFVAWVNKNPLRVALGNEAAKNNFEAAKNLWDMWDEYKELKGGAQATPETKKKVPGSVKSAPVEARAEKIYSRAKLMELRMKVENGDPAATARWKDPEFQRNMIQAYQEDRVR